MVTYGQSLYSKSRAKVSMAVTIHVLSLHYIILLDKPGPFAVISLYLNKTGCQIQY